MMYYPYTNMHRQQHTERIVTVTGVGEVAIQPDTATVQLSVMTENDQLTIAQQDNAKIMTQVIQSLKQLGISDNNIRTTLFQIHPRYDYVDGRQVFRGYEVVNTISVTLNNFADIGRVIDIAVENGVNQVSNIEFFRSDRLQFEGRALQLALENAQAKAQAIADQLQVQLDPIPTKITEQVEDHAVPFKTFSLTEQAPTTPIEPGQIMVRAIVRVQYEY